MEEQNDGFVKGNRDYGSSITVAVIIFSTIVSVFPVIVCCWSGLRRHIWTTIIKRCPSHGQIGPPPPRRHHPRRRRSLIYHSRTAKSSGESSRAALTDKDEDDGDYDEGNKMVNTSTEAPRPTSWPTQTVRLLIDGCNGPIKFSPDGLSDAECTRSGNSNSNSNSNNTTAATPTEKPSLFSILWSSVSCLTVYSQNDHRWNRNSRRTSTRKKSFANDVLTLINIHSNISEQRQQHRHRQYHHHESLDLINSLHHLLHEESDYDDSYEDGKKEEDDNVSEDTATNRILPACSIIFDGVARFSSSRLDPPESSSKEEKRIQQQEQEHRNHKKKMDSDQIIYRISEEIQIEITARYDEADNVLVDRCLRTKNERRIVRNIKPSPCYYEIVIVERTEIGAGKNRSIFQPLQLLRPKSVLCLFMTGFPPKLHYESKQTLQKLQNIQQNKKRKSGSTSSSSSSWFEFKTVRFESTSWSMVQQSPQTKLSRSLSSSDSAGNNTNAERLSDDCDASSLAIKPTIVVTDDIYLRQRVVYDANCFVMTFDQLWTLLRP